MMKLMQREEDEIEAMENAILPPLKPIAGLKLDHPFDLVTPQERAEFAHAADIIDRTRRQAYIRAREIVLL